MILDILTSFLSRSLGNSTLLDLTESSPQAPLAQQPSLPRSTTAQPQLVKATLAALALTARLRVISHFLLRLITERYVLLLLSYFHLLIAETPF